MPGIFRSSGRGVSARVAVALLAVALLSSCGDNKNSSMFQPSGPNQPGAAGGGSGGTGGSGSGSSTVAYVYVGSGPFSGPGQIYGFSVAGDSTAHVLNGSPFAGASGSVVASSGYVIATDGTNIQAYLRNGDGSLVAGPSINGTAHNETPQDSGVGVLAFDRTGQDLYASEINFQGADNDSYASFQVQPGGNLKFVNNAGISVYYYSGLSFTQDNRYAYGQGCYFNDWELFGLARMNDGSLQPFDDKADMPPQQNPMDNYCPQRSAASALGYLAVAVANTGSTEPEFLVTYHINGDGTLGLVQNFRLPSTTGVNAMAFDPTGNYLAAGGPGGVQIYQLAPGGVLVPVGGPQQGSVTFDALEWDTTGHLYAVGNSQLYIYNSTNGLLSLASGSPYPVANGATIAVLPAK